MLKNYLTVALRNIRKHKLLSFINIAGLTAGMTCCFLIMLFVRHELSYDSFHENADRIYRIKYTPKFVAAGMKYARIPPPVAPLLPEYFPEIETSARLYQRSASITVEGDEEADRRHYEENRFYFADSTLFNIFTFGFKQGSPGNALSEPFSVVITESIAEKYFGTTDALGRMIVFAGHFPFRVSGVFEDFPMTAHMRPELLASYESMFATENEFARTNLPQNWVISHSFTYVLLHRAHSAAAVDGKMQGFLDAHAHPQFKNHIEFTLEPLRAIHLRTETIMNPEPTGNIRYIYIFSAIAFITLLIACFNFVNLSTARSLKRAKEVGMRKVLGANRGKVVTQFLGESLILGFIAFACSLALIELLLPLLNTLTNRSIDFSYTGNASLLAVYLSVFLATGILAGAYPAIFISSFQPITALRGRTEKNVPGAPGIRKVLIVAQFVATIALIAGTMIVYLQLQYWRNQPLGFNKEHVLVIPLFSSNINNAFGGMTPELRDRLRTFENELLANPSIEAMTLASHLPGIGAVIRNIIPEGYTAEDNIFIAGISVDYDFIETFGLELVAGRDFSEDYGSDHQNAFIINETGAMNFGWADPQEALGKSVNREGKSGTIVGVMRDFPYRSLQYPIEGYLLDVAPQIFTTVSIRIDARNVPGTINYIEEMWTNFFPEKVFEYRFLDEQIDEAYNQEERLAMIVGNFSLLAIVISILGLYGLIRLAAEQRTKEIGIRKVLGASVAHVVYILTKEFTLLIVVAFFIAVPIIYGVMNSWLADFAYRIPLSAGIFLTAGFFALFVALATVSIQAVKSARINPAESVKYE